MTVFSTNSFLKGYILIWVLLFSYMPISKELQAQQIKLRSFSKIGGNFILHDMHGNKVQLIDFKQKIVILFFGYTLCPDICPNTLFVMADVLKQLGEMSSNVKLIFITLDPKRDTGKRLNEYLSIFDNRIIGLRGDEKSTVAITKKYVTRFRKKKLGSTEEYLIDHTAYTFLIDQNSTIRYIFPYKTTPGFMVKTVIKLLAETS
ncbi:MAG: SCO family protein [Deltaproteobacteria bacterium]|jgi:protein SCO1|nr:SCO family protein [Deltaproteobacteria bacterium]MBT4262880.1 SCO family protein [Deltaproteobacteria bacterium]MBT4643874.1 SCO family protein [Deltaproteobacteria bacterium]MBT6499241.1 SCO family protein [Deltaproteobacteria bacterium]MBT6615691.1 SCO family protein [Deltaproteobacteria bacterium]